MRMRPSLSVGVVLIALVVSRGAHAANVEASLEVGYGSAQSGESQFFTDVSTIYNLNPFGASVGLQLGATLGRFYVGVSARRFEGDSKVVSLQLDPNAPLTRMLYVARQLGADVGYGWTLGRWLIRPHLWLGPTAFTLTTSSAPCRRAGGCFGDPGNVVRMTLGPSVLVRFRLAGPLFLGADARASVFLPAENERTRAQITVVGTVGASL